VKAEAAKRNRAKLREDLEALHEEELKRGCTPEADCSGAWQNLW
jgi:hypothetical protein